MQSTAVLALLDAHTAAGRAAASPAAALATLPAVFAAVPDPRSRHGQRDDLPFLLTGLVAALLCGCDSLDAVGQWTRERRAPGPPCWAASAPHADGLALAPPAAAPRGGAPGSRLGAPGSRLGGLGAPNAPAA